MEMEGEGGVERLGGVARGERRQLSQGLKGEATSSEFVTHS